MTTHNDQVFQFGGAPVGISFRGMWGNCWFVDAENGRDTGNTGKKPNSAFASVTTALTFAGDYDTIFMAPGNYDTETAMATVTQDYLSIIGTLGHGGYGQAARKVFWRGDYASSFHDILNIEGDGVEVAGVTFYVPRGSYPGSHDGSGVTNDYRGISIGYAGTANPGGTYIHDCYFFCEGVTYGTGIAVGERTVSEMGDAMDTTIERCIFHQMGAGVYADASRCMVKDCYFIVNGCGGTAAAGIMHRPNAAERINSAYLNNKFVRNTHGSNGSPYGVMLYGTPTSGTLFMDGNHCSGNFADETHCLGADNTSILLYNGHNYYEDAIIT